MRWFIWLLYLCIPTTPLVAADAKKPAISRPVQSGQAQVVTATMNPETTEQLKAFEKTDNTLLGRFILTIRTVTQPELADTSVIIALAQGGKKRDQPTKDSDLGHLGTYSFFCDAACRKITPTTSFTIDATDTFYALRKAKKKSNGKVEVLLWVRPPEKADAKNPSILVNTTATLSFNDD